MSYDDQAGPVPEKAELSIFCPFCYQGLNVFDPKTSRIWLRLFIKFNAEKDFLFLSPRLNEFERSSPLPLAEGQVVNDILCPLCGASLLEGGRCGDCGSPVAKLLVSARARPIPFYICSRVGCRWNGLSPRDEIGIKPKVGRQKMPEQDAMLRTRNFMEVTYGFTREIALAEASRCLGCKNPTCVGGCPVEIDIPAFIHSIQEQKFLEAARKIKERNALPAICGRVCPQEDQCERTCLLGHKGEPVAIGSLERFVADFERETDAVAIPRRASPNGFRIAAVGSGPTGLTLAADLTVLGYSVTVFEALHKPGGVLIYGIPEFRLPKAIVEAEMNYLRRLGVKFELNSIIGRLYTVEELFQIGYHAVYIGTGAGLPVFLKITGENLCNIFSANEYLTRINLMKAYAFPDYDTPAPRGRQVVIIGGGNVAMDCARNALRMGSREVTVVYRRTREEMPARQDEIRHAEEEGIRFRFLTNPIRFVGDDQRWVRQMECVQMKLGDPDASGRPRPIPIAGSNFLLETDMVVVAIGAGPNPVLFSRASGLDRNERGYIKVFTSTGRTSLPKVWAGGDIVTGAATVILAMGAARQAGNDIHAYLTQGEKSWP